MATWAGLKEYRARLRAEGKCTRCHKANDRHPDRAMCTGCAEACKGSLYAGRKRWSKDPRRCSVCSMEPEPGMATCARCLATGTRSRRRAVAEGCCANCYRPMPEAGWTRCSVCNENDRARSRLREAVNQWRN